MVLIHVVLHPSIFKLVSFMFSFCTFHLVGLY